MKLTDNTILITGGATGIGFALAEALVARGNTVIVCGRSEESLAGARSKRPELLTRRCDVTDPPSRSEMVAWLEEAHPELNMLVNNAGVQFPHDLTDRVSDAAVSSEVAVNLIAPILLVSDLLPLLRRQPSATIVNVTSGLAFAPLADIPVYCATKAALHSYTLSLRHQLKGTPIAVIEVAPPIVDTELGGASRGGRTDGQPVLSPEAFVREVMPQLADGRDEVLVGLSIGTRKQGEALFGRMNT
jgi:uncharacterized oxidoreductase